MITINPTIWKSLPGPQDIHRFSLPNGITILTRSNFNSPSVVLNGYLASGSMFDTDELLGLSYFTALSISRGTQQHNFQAYFDALESVGASLGFGSSVHNTNFGGRSLSEDLPLLLQLLSESLRQPVFPAEQVERLRHQILTGLAIRAQDTGESASLEFDKLIFPNHPYGRPEDGYIETIQRITREDIVEFHRSHYGPKGMVIVVVGAVAPETVFEQVKAVFGDWQNEAQVPPPVLPEVKPAPGIVRKHINIAGKSQSDLIIGMLGPKRKDPDYLAISLGNSVLGQFGMMGRIGDVVREQAGLAYYASTSLNAWINSGSWEVSAGVNPANLQRAIDLILVELQRFVAEPVSLEELENSQSNYIGRLPLSMESNGGVASALLNLERFQLGLDYYHRYPDLVQNISPQKVLEASRRWMHPENLTIVSAGSDKAPAAGEELAG
jgi:zinc protease